MKKQSKSRNSGKLPANPPQKEPLSPQEGLILPHCGHRRLGRRSGGAGAIPAACAGKKRHGLCHRPAPRPDAQGDHARTPPTRHRNGGIPGQRPDAGPAGMRLCDSAQQGDVHPARGFAPVRSCRAQGTPSPHRFLPPLPGRGPAGAEHRRHPFGDGFRRHNGLKGHQGKGRGGAGAGARLGQVRQHAPKRHRRRPGRPGGPGGGTSRKDHRLSAARHPHRQDRHSP